MDLVVPILVGEERMLLPGWRRERGREGGQFVPSIDSKIRGHSSGTWKKKKKRERERNFIISSSPR